MSRKAGAIVGNTVSEQICEGTVRRDEVEEERVNLRNCGRKNQVMEKRRDRPY